MSDKQRLAYGAKDGVSRRTIHARLRRMSEYLQKRVVQGTMSSEKAQADLEVYKAAQLKILTKLDKVSTDLGDMSEKQDRQYDAIVSNQTQANADNAAAHKLILDEISAGRADTLSLKRTIESGAMNLGLPASSSGLVMPCVQSEVAAQVCEQEVSEEEVREEQAESEEEVSEEQPESEEEVSEEQTESEEEAEVVECSVMDPAPDFTTFDMAAEIDHFDRLKMTLDTLPEEDDTNIDHGTATAKAIFKTRVLITLLRGSIDTIHHLKWLQVCKQSDTPGNSHLIADSNREEQEKLALEKCIVSDMWNLNTMD